MVEKELEGCNTEARKLSASKVHQKKMKHSQQKIGAYTGKKL
jgi:hypothetical protein